MSDLNSDDPRFHYFDECMKGIEPAIDLLSKINDKYLILEEYSLGEA